MAGRGVAQKEPLQSRSYVVCTWTQLDYPQMCLFLYIYVCGGVWGRKCLINVLLSNVLLVPMCAEALCLRANEFAVDTSWHPKAHIQPVFSPLSKHFSFVVLILLWSEQFASIVITDNP